MPVFCLFVFFFWGEESLQNIFIEYLLQTKCCPRHRKQSEYYRQKLCLLGVYSEGDRPKSIMAQKCIITSLYMFHEEEHQGFKKASDGRD